MTGISGLLTPTLVTAPSNHVRKFEVQIPRFGIGSEPQWRWDQQHTCLFRLKIDSEEQLMCEIACTPFSTNRLEQALILEAKSTKNFLDFADVPTRAT